MTTLLSPSTCKTLVDALPDAALVMTSDNFIIAANQQANAMFEAGLVGQPAALFLRSPAVLRGIAEAREQQEPREAEFDVRAKVARTVHVHVSPLGFDEAGPLVLALLRDRTREEQIERMRSDFVANASHELRTPLTTLSGFIETMQGAAARDEKARGQFLSLMKAQAERMSLLIDDLLSLSRIELDEHIAPDQPVDLVHVVNQVKNLLQTQVAEDCSTLEVIMPNKLVVRGDNNQLAQVLHNLIENALKYAGKGKHIKVSGAAAGRAAVVNVSDNGPGIASHHIPRLTERFYRVNAQDSRTRGGTGLGLAICKHIINRHRGQLKIESEVGHGTTFSVVLPLSQDQKNQ